MRKSKLTAQQKKVLRSASREAVQTALQKLDGFFQRDIWLGKTNKYRINTIQRLKRANTVRDIDLSEYIAVSAILHCFDGWIFLGRAIGALSNGDSHTSHHLAYYAELRAAMSLLAGEGIGIFNTSHYVLQDHLTLHCQLVPINLGTHKFTWLVLEHWAGLMRSNALLQQVITPSGIPLATWFEGFRAGVNARIVGTEWLTTWGLDLKTIGHDHEGRNEVSYRPNHLVYQSPVDLIETSSYLQRLWELFQPYGGSRFESLDRLLLRVSLRKIFSAISGNTPETNIADYQARIIDMLNTVNPPGLPHDAWIAYLTDNQQSPILEAAQTSDNVTFSNRHHFSVIARAALLLRVASGSVARILSASSIRKEDISFWWKTYSVDFGIMEPTATIDNMEDLWADIELALLTLNDWQQKHLTEGYSYYQWSQDLGKEIKRLEECERVSFWGMGL